MSAPDLLSWLRSTIEGDKATAEANGDETWTAHDEGESDNWSITIGDGPNKTANSCGCCCVGALDQVEADHIALHDPRDTIARCEAELTILDQVLPEVRRIGVRLAEEFGGIWRGDRLTPSEKILLEALASGYRHREGFNPDWVVGEGTS